MNLQQLEYIVAVDKYRHFARAAEACFVTQPTLSMMIHKLEEEFGVTIFNRSIQPVEPTRQGAEIIEQAKKILGEARHMQEIIDSNRNILQGELNLDIIPTLSAYLIPLFVSSFMQKYPLLNIRIEENNTDIIIERLKKGWTDAALLSTPLDENFIAEIPLFYEELFYYSGKECHQKSISVEEIHTDELLLLEEGHCLRSQIENFCNLGKDTAQKLFYKSGNLETLKRLVENNQGNTILPELATSEFNDDRKSRLIRFKKPYPVREISLVINKNFARKKVIECLKEEILNSLPEKLKNKSSYQRLEINK